MKEILIICVTINKYVLQKEHLLMNDIAFAYKRKIERIGTFKQSPLYR